jgi:hypothetical protein
MAVHCPECGFVNAEGANYCQRCGAFIGAVEAKEPSTATYRVGETGELIPVELDDVVAEGAALVIRAGVGLDGLHGQAVVAQRRHRERKVSLYLPICSSSPSSSRCESMRRPDSDVFLDDVTVSPTR